jgi:hypothetical protein
LSLAHAGIWHSSMLEMFSGIEECQITAWASANMSLAYAVILHSSRPEMSETCFIFYVLCSNTLGNFGRVVRQDQFFKGCEFDPTLRPLYLFFTQ